MKLMRTLSAAFLLSLAAATSALAQTTEGWLDDYDQALAQAKVQKRLVLIAFTASDVLPNCKKLAADVFATPEFKDFAAKNLILMEVDFPKAKEQSKQLKERNRDLNGRIGGRSFPVLVVVDENGKEQGRFVGYDGKGAKVMIAKLQAYVDSPAAPAAPAK